MSTFNQFQLYPAMASIDGGIAAVSRISNSMEVFWINNDGSVHGAFWYEGGNWTNYELAPAGSASATGGITVVSRVPTSMEVFWIGQNGSVQDAYWYEGGSWQRFELAPANSAAVNGSIAAVSRIPTSMEVFWIGQNGSVQDAYWYEGGNWNRFELAPANSASTNGSIAVVSRVSNSIEVFWIGQNGSVQDAYWYEGNNWQRFEHAPAGSASSNGSIAAVSRIPNSMDIFWIGENGSVQDTFWYEGGNWNRFELAPAGSASATGTIAVVSRIPNSMEVFWIGQNGSIQDAYWYEGSNWNRYELFAGGNASSNGSIAVVSRVPGSMELWFTGSNGGIQDGYWYEGFDSIVLTHDIVTSGIDAFGGSVEITINRNGNVRFKGHVHDSGAEGYDFNIRAIVHSDSPIVLVMQKSGSVEGTVHSGIFDAPRRDFDWDETTFNPNVASSFDDFIKKIKLDVYSSDTGEITGVLENIADFAIRWIGGAALINPLTGLIIFVGVEIGSIAMGSGFVGGARVIGSTLWFAGPWGTLYAIAAEGIVALGEKERELTDFEYDFANNNVFKGTLPPKGDIILTDTIGGNHRAFTMPRWDGKITINMGSDGYQDPLNYELDRKQRGQVFIHELTHAWQIKNTHWETSLLASALASKICEAGGGDPYDFGTDASKPFNDFNLEQQAKIVDDWFAKCAKDEAGNIIDNIASPWYHYIEGNIRVGQL